MGDVVSKILVTELGKLGGIGARIAARFLPDVPHECVFDVAASPEDVRAAAVFDRVSLGGLHLAGAGFDVGQDARHLAEIGRSGDLWIAGTLQHLRELLLQSLDGPTDRVPIGYRVHSVELAHAAVGPRGQAIQIGILRPIDARLVVAGRRPFRPKAAACTRCAC